MTTNILCIHCKRSIIHTLVIQIFLLVRTASYYKLHVMIYPWIVKVNKMDWGGVKLDQQDLAKHDLNYGSTAPVIFYLI